MKKQKPGNPDQNLRDQTSRDHEYNKRTLAILGSNEFHLHERMVRQPNDWKKFDIEKVARQKVERALAEGIMVVHPLERDITYVPFYSARLSRGVKIEALIEFAATKIELPISAIFFQAQEKGLVEMKRENDVVYMP
jgi:hypothetical protein